VIATLLLAKAHALNASSVIITLNQTSLRVSVYPLEEMARTGSLKCLILNQNGKTSAKRAKERKQLSRAGPMKHLQEVNLVVP